MFTETLRQIVADAGADGAVVLSLDGLCIEAVGADGEPVEPGTAEREYANVFKQLLFVGETVPMGDADEVTIEGDDRTTVARRLTDQYLVAMHVPAGSIVGKAHFHLRVAAPDLAREL